MKKKLSISIIFLTILGVGIVGIKLLNKPSIMVKGASIVTARDFRMKVESKWDNVNEKNYVELDWDNISDLTQKGYRLFQSEDQGTTWDNRSTNYGKVVKVLNIYPDRAESNTFKAWMDSLNMYNEKNEKLIEVTPVSNKDYNMNPLKYLKDGKGDWKYDVITIGSWDRNNHVKMEKEPSDYIMDFINDGRGVLFGHDTIAGDRPDVVNENKNMEKFAEKLGITFGHNYASTGQNTTHWAGSKKIKLVNDGYLMKFPFEMEENVVLTIPDTHNIEVQKKDVGEVWFEFIDLSMWGVTSIFDDGEYRSGWYLKTNENVSMIQTGHSNGASTESENKIIANTLYNLAQVSLESYADDYSVSDDVAPEKAVLTNLGGTFESFTIGINSLDKGKEYQWYVEADSKSKGLLKSDVVEETIISNIAGYFYQIDDLPTSDLSQEVESYKNSYGRIPEEKYDLYVAPPNSTAITYDTTAKIFGINGAKDADKYLHVVAVDRANNISEVTTIQINEVMTEFQITETYSDDFGNQLQEDNHVNVAKKENYSKVFPSISSYLNYGYQIDNTNIVEVVDAESVVRIPDVTKNYTLNYIYTKPAKLHIKQVIEEESESIAIPEKGKVTVINSKGGTTGENASKSHYDIQSGVGEGTISFSDIETKRKINYDFLNIQLNVPSFYQIDRVETLTNLETGEGETHNYEQSNLSLQFTASTSEYWITYYLRPVIDPGVYLNIVNNRLNVYYSNIDHFNVFIDGEKYKEFSVTNKATTESKVIDIPVSEIRNKVSVEYLNADGNPVTVYWNNTWEFVNDN
ncbi:hypothetical protein CKN86_06535 [Carnobacterium divergens]|uniref:hypothetical protein n=1 Tax=Carnobacterium divergens TaxID=2748 RepID=UPI000D419B7B|nr:hypothetical protein [Carnobacterium divergens]MCO6016974.1 hypothetical protein [Carnobacterium divergens]TFJ04750.1 hypothetical protein CKN86_06535 [Carnobacterium divergens]TFJ45353.1 hypothetical protein CKN79_06705 [Carnobacterium divergens]TFJ51810.1 hypothetical protein CKN80_06710 [Carnobacterium divergens]SPC41316.1 conserved exported hypothetical protein [Carnobacterium divergens]